MTDDEFLVRRWADGCVLFDRLLGSTHALQPAAMIHVLGEGDPLPPSGNIRAMIKAMEASSQHSAGVSADVSLEFSRDPFRPVVNSN
jgi:hypothetical protein